MAEGCACEHCGCKNRTAAPPQNVTITTNTAVTAADIIKAIKLYERRNGSGR